MKFKNLTSHEINIFDAEGRNQVLTLSKPDDMGAVARCTTQSKQIGREGNVPIFAIEFGEVTNLPPKQEGIGYVVSFLVRDAANRDDLYSPGELLRDVEGKSIGCKGLQK